MKRIKTKDIDISKLITKSQYARKYKIQAIQVTRMVQNGKLTVIPIQGGEIIHE